MAPTLIASSFFNKNIGEFAHQGETRFVRFGYMVAATSLFKLTELELIAPEDDIHTYITIEQVGGTYGNQTAVSEKILDLKDDGISEAEIIGHLLASELLDENANIHAGRIALRSYCFVEDGNEVSCNQVAGVGVEEAFQKKGISSRAYLFLLNWFEHLVCDDTQTIPGAKIWAGTLIRACEVRIYNENGHVFEDVLGELGKGRNRGFLPWNKGMLTDVSTWQPNEVRPTAQKYIVLVISRDTSLTVGLLPSVKRQQSERVLT
ncbi:hypothetical protein [Erwinia pyrifoliae]|uniref:Uncharacterized protein n=1 Tax=Erwinia pyrifoliae TaxID=79967 RepID=A0ABY5X9C1_ERWPY|nr:hypothetical protein [Erwinia pyrifoliae]AUX74199.1 hypothetical protein CPI84_18150 [Erwinia pyrifoliae]MCA8875450.1 hypothetical protein [Erwinia pyrifoliae]MCT2385258.1 hypothetical protein [Erwinia pyrifoliae]MCU8585518.1 hypothetical protein [Erwinia pyrifoliae]UWS29505.1 hypothetical protein NYP81_16745 [Erwinia pyrifoliae]